MLHGMAIITPALYQARTNQTFTGDALTQVSAMCEAIDDAIRSYIKPFKPEPVTLTVVRDAPPTNVLLLGAYPVRSITSLYLKWDANGDPSAFTSDDLLTQYTDYFMPIDDDDGNYSRSGIVYRRGGSVWAAEYRRPIQRLGSVVEPCRGAVKVVMECGPTAVEERMLLAATNAVSLALKRVKFGTTYASESWNGYSYSFPANFLVGVLASPDVSGYLAKYVTVGVSAG